MTNKNLFPVLLLPVLLGLSSPLAAGPELDPLRRIAIQAGGRTKPLDTFARETVRRVTGARAFGAESVKYGPDRKSRMDPMEWLLAMLVDPEKWRAEPVIRVTHAGLREASKLPDGKDHFSYNELTAHQPFLDAADKVHEKLRADSEAKLDPIEREISTLYETLGAMSGVFSGDAWRMVPHPDDPKATWYSLRELDSVQAPEIGRVRTLVYALVRTYQEGDRSAMGDAAAALGRRLAEMAPSVYPEAKTLQTEVHYNRFKPFRTAWGLYLLGFLALLTSFGAPSRWLPGAGYLFILSAFAVHAYGMVLRILISGRPPVTNMYESVIWVAWSAVLLALVFEMIYKARFFATCASAVAVISLILADNVPILDGSIDPLVPVLRDNMWLTIHVLTITLAYGAFFLAMAIGHVNLGLYFFAPGSGPLLRMLSNFLYRVLQVGTLLGIVGTLLGLVGLVLVGALLGLGREGDVDLRRPRLLPGHPARADDRLAARFRDGGSERARLPGRVVGLVRRQLRPRRGAALLWVRLGRLHVRRRLRPLRGVGRPGGGAETTGAPGAGTGSGRRPELAARSAVGSSSRQQGGSTCAKS